MSVLRREIAAHLPALARYARALTGERASAEDLVQDCVARALAAEAGWRGDNAKAWLFAILTNLNRSRQRADAALALSAPDGIERIGTAVTEPALRLGVDRALASLSAEQREVLLMVGLEGMSYAQAAAALGVPPGTVMSRLSRARAAFRAALDGRADPAPFRRVK